MKGLLKKAIAILTVVSLIVVAMPMSLPVAATGANLKTTLTDYAGQGGLSYTSTRLMSFDNTTGINRNALSSSISVDRSNKKQGSGCLSTTASTDNSSFVALQTSVGAFNFTVTDPYAQNLKMWVYVGDCDLIACDHDAVYDTPQEDSFTLYVTLGNSTSSYNYSVQHTMHGSGWQEIDINFATDNVSYNTRKNINWNFRYMKIWCKAYAGATIKFDDLRLIQYNTTYEMPECENNGRWISTCDYNALDGCIISEWYGSSFDLDEKTQGTSSLRIDGYKVHVDYRVTLSGLSTKAYRDRDVFCMDMYIDDIRKLSTGFEARVGENESSTDKAFYSFGYPLMNMYANGGEGLKSGWNTLQMPLSKMGLNVNEEYFGEGYEDITVYKITLYNPGTQYSTADDMYTIRYDNMYLTDISNLDLGFADEDEEYTRITVEPAENSDKIKVSKNWRESTEDFLDNSSGIYTPYGGIVNLNFVGTEFAVSSYVGPDQGSLYISLDGGEEQEISLLSTASEVRRVYSVNGLSSSGHTIRIRASKSAYIDSFSVLGNLIDCAVCEECGDRVYEAEVISAEGNKSVNDMQSTLSDTSEFFYVSETGAYDAPDDCPEYAYFFEPEYGIERKSGFSIKNSVMADLVGNEDEWTVDTWIYISDATSAQAILQIAPYGGISQWSVYNNNLFSNTVENWSYRLRLFDTEIEHGILLEQGWNHLQIPLSEFKLGIDENNHTYAAYERLSETNTIEGITLHENDASNYGKYTIAIASFDLVKNAEHTCYVEEEIPEGNDELTYGDFTYTVLDENAVITGYIGNGGDVTVPSKVNGYTVTGISDYAFSGCNTITNITLSDTVVSIGESAFFGCTKLCSINIPNGVTSIKKNTFNECTALNSITLPDSVVNIGGSAFQGCTSLKAVDIPDGITEIGAYTFANAGLLSVTLPESVTTVGIFAFSGCSDLREINVPVSVVYIYSGAFYGCDALSKVKYGGNSEKWALITINEDNDALLNADVVFTQCYDNDYSGFCDGCGAVLESDELRLISLEGAKSVSDLLCTYEYIPDDLSVVASQDISGNATALRNSDTYLYETTAGSLRKDGFAVQKNIYGDFVGNEDEWIVNAWVYISDITSYHIIMQFIPQDCLVAHSLYNSTTFTNIVENWAYRYSLTPTSGTYNAALNQGWNHLQIPLSAFKLGTSENVHTNKAYSLLDESNTITAVTFHENNAANYGGYTFGVAGVKLTKEYETDYEIEYQEIEDNLDNVVVSNAWVKRYNKNHSGKYALHTTSGGKVQFSFYGTAFSVRSYKSPSQGRIYISIDGKEEFLAADLYDSVADTNFNCMVYESSTLSDTKHTVTIRAEGKVYIDALGIAGYITQCTDPIHDDVIIEAENMINAEYTGNWTKKYSWYHSGHNAMYNTDGGSINFDFEGDEFSVISYKSSTQGNLYVSIDGGEEVEVYLGNETESIFATEVYSVSGLDYKIHTVTIRTQGKAYIDAIVINRKSAETVTYEVEDGEISLGGDWSQKYAWKHSAHNAMYTSAGGEATFVYTGYDFRILSYMAKSQGMMYVSIDGGEVVEINLYDDSTDTKYKEIVFEAAGMDYGTHSVEIITVGKVYLDAVKIDGVLN